MKRQGRFFRPKDKTVLGTKYDSTLERELDLRLSAILTPGTPPSEPSSKKNKDESCATIGDKSSQCNGPAEYGFHTDKIPYLVEHKYNPDFTVRFPNGRVIHIEAKGYFQDAHETQKYPWIKKVLPEGHELVFLFEKPDKPIHFKSVRKCGTKMSHGEYCEKNGFRFFTLETIEEIFN